MEVSVSLSPQYTEDKSPAAAHALNPKLNPRAHTFSFTKLSICTSVGFFTFWLAALCLSCWLAAAGFGFETPVSGFREQGVIWWFSCRRTLRESSASYGTVWFVYLPRQCNDQPQRDSCFEPLLQAQYPVGCRPADTLPQVEVEICQEGDLGFLRGL